MEIKQIFTDQAKLIGQEIIVNGWIKTSRSSKNCQFIELTDGSCFSNLQIVFDQSLPDFETISKLAISTSLEVKGTLEKSPASGQTVELKAQQITVIGKSSADYPLQKKDHSMEFLRTIAHLRSRSNIFKAVFRIRGLLSFALHKFFNEQGFVQVHTPIITGNDCEGAGEMFKVTTLDLLNPPMVDKKIDYTKDFFSKEVNLTVSGQLEAETMALALNKVYTFGPTFRAENSNTKRHLAEFWMLEPEMAFADLAQDMDLAEAMMKYVIKYLTDNAPEELTFLNKFVDQGLMDRLNNLLAEPFERITYDQAIELLTKAETKFEFKPTWGDDLQTEHEKYLTEQVFKKPVFVTDYPKQIKAFYMRLNEDEKTVAAMDLLVPTIGEIIGGSQREECPDTLLARMKEFSLDEKNYDWYLDLRRYGTVPHAGFGLGFERLIMYVTGIENVRDVIPFPRVPGNAEF